MTDDEHRARAMLLGGRWSGNSRMYRIYNEVPGPAFTYLDDTTLEPIPAKEVLERYARTRLSYKKELLLG